MQGDNNRPTAIPSFIHFLILNFINLHRSAHDFGIRKTRLARKIGRRIDCKKRGIAGGNHSVEVDEFVSAHVDGNVHALSKEPFDVAFDAYVIDFLLYHTEIISVRKPF